MGNRGQNGGKVNRGRRGQNRNQSPPDDKLAAQVDAAVAHTQQLLKQRDHTIAQLKEQVSVAKSGGVPPAARKPPAQPLTTTLPKKQDTSADGDTWLCFGCKTSHHNMALKACRSCHKKRPEGAPAGPAPAELPTTYWGPVQDRKSQAVLKRVGANPALTLTAKPKDGEDAPMEPSAQETEQIKANTNALINFLLAQSPQDSAAIKIQREKLEALSATKTTDKPTQDLGLLTTLMGNQAAYNKEQGNLEAEILEASLEVVRAAEEAHHTLHAEQQAKKIKRDELLIALQGTVAELRQQCEFSDCVEVQADSVAPGDRTLAQAPSGATVAEVETVGEDKEAVTQLIQYVAELEGLLVAPTSRPPQAASLLQKLTRKFAAVAPTVAPQPRQDSYDYGCLGKGSGTSTGKAGYQPYAVGPTTSAEEKPDDDLFSQ